MLSYHVVEQTDYQHCGLVVPALQHVKMPSAFHSRKKRGIQYRAQTELLGGVQGCAK